MLSPVFRSSTSVILRRCSSAPQVQNSMENQGRTVEVAVAEHNLQVIDDIRLEGVTGSIPSLRTDIDDIIKLKTRHPSLRLVVVPDTTRFTRVGSHHGQKLLYDLEAVGIFAYFVAEDIVNDTPIAKMYLSFLFDSANQQARSIARNGTMGSERSFLEGNSPHTRLTPYGLDRLYLVDGVEQHILRNMPDGTQQMLHPQTKQLIRTFGRNEKKGIPNHYIKQKSERIVLIPGDPGRVAIVSMIFHLRYVDRLSIRTIARMLNDLGVKSAQGIEWHTDTVHRILLSAVYLGTGIRNKSASGIYVVSSGKGEPLPSTATLQDLVKEKPKPKRRSREEWIERPQSHLVEFLPESVRGPAAVAIEDLHERQGTAKPVVPDKDKHAKTSNYVLSKLMTSNPGNHPMTGQSKPDGKGGLYRRYMVSRGQTVPKTDNDLSGTIRADAVEPAVMNIVREVILQKDDLRQALLRAVEEASRDRSEVADTESISKEIAKRQKRVINLSRRLIDDEQIDAPIEAEIDRLHDEVRDLNAKLRFAQQTQAPADADPSLNIEALLVEFEKHVEGLQQTDPAAAKDLVRLLVGRMQADLKTKEVEIELSVPKSLGRMLIGAKPVCLVSAFGCGTGHQAHPDSRLKIENHVCILQKQQRQPCYVCRREAA